MYIRYFVQVEYSWMSYLTEKDTITDFCLNAGHKHFILPEEIKQIGERNGFNFLGVYSALCPSFMNSWFTHAKYVNICQKI